MQSPYTKVINNNSCVWRLTENQAKIAMDVLKIEACFRVSAVLLLILAACLVGLDAQSRIIFIEKRITYKDLQSFVALLYASSSAAAYNLLQLGRCVFSNRFKGNSNESYRYLAWVCYLFDQIVVYVTYATTTAAVEHSGLVLTGMKEFQWMTWCSKFARFCFQMGGGLACCYAASALMALTTFISAFNLFSLYSSDKFLRLKNT